MREGNYWDRLARRRLSRRSLLRNSAYAGAGLTAAAIVGCGGDGDENGGQRQRSQELSYEITEGQPGGTMRISAFVFHDTYDPHLTQFGPIYSPLSGVFSKVLMYTDIYENIMQPDLAESMPEQPDEQTYIVRLRDARFHNKPPVNGRAVDAEDVKFMIERQRDGTDPRFYRKSQWQTVDRVEVVDPKTLRIITKGPVAPLQHFLADTNAHVIPRELLASKNELGTGVGDPGVDMIGSGPFMWDRYQILQEYRAVKNPDWFGWDQPDLRRPYLDAYILNSATANDPSTRQSAFQSKQLDWAGFGDQPTQLTDEFMRRFPELQLWEYGTSGYINSRFLVDRPPFNDYRIRTALNIVIDRNQMIEAIFFGAAQQNGVVSWAIPAWTLSPDEVAQHRGYRFGQREREEDLAEARRMWDAAGGPSLGTLRLLVANIPTYLPQYAPQIQEQVRRHLGAEVQFEVVSYQDIAERLLRGELGWGFGFDNGWIDLDDWLYPYYHSGGPKNSFNFSDPEVDRLLDQQRQEFDYERRREIGYEIQRHMLQETVNIHLNFISPLSRTLVWPYVKNFRGTPWFGNDFRLADYWIDTSDPSYQGRP